MKKLNQVENMEQMPDMESMAEDKAEMMPMKKMHQKMMGQKVGMSKKKKITSIADLRAAAKAMKSKKMGY